MTDDIRQYVPKHKDLRLERVNSDNCFDLADLTVAEDQTDFLAPNQESMMLAYGTLMEGKYVEVFGIYDGPTPVGFVMIGHNSFSFDGCPEVYAHSYDLWRFMIDRRYQGQGYGRDALKLILDYMLTFPDGEEALLTTSYVETNQKAKNLYLSFGFVPNGDTCGNEVILTLPVK